MTLRRRLALILGGIVAVTIPITAVLASWVATPSLLGAVDELLSDQVDTFEQVLSADPSRLDDIEEADPSPINQTTFRVQLIEPDGTIIGDPSLPLDANAVDQAAEDGQDHFRTIELDGHSFRVLVRAIDQGVVQAASDIEPIQNGLADLRRTIRIGAVVSIVVAAAAGWFVASRFTRPIVEVSDAAAQLAQQRGLPEPIVTDRTDEVGQLAASFNELLDALDVSRQQQARLVADASHELRTPLTSLRMKVEFLQSEPSLSPEQRAQVIDGAAAELGELGALVEELVDLAASTNTDEPTQDVNLAEIVEEVAARARLTTGRTITTSVSGTVVRARPAMVRRAVSNLIGNAAKYSPTDTPIEVAEFNGGIEVRDHGPGFAPADCDHAFDRFYRSPTVQHTPGSGIGLAIVKQVADSHDGRVWIDDAQGGGAVVGFSVAAIVRPGVGQAQ